jgi:uncharacterized membrane protein YraQ (UPF0718 family)
MKAIVAVMLLLAGALVVLAAVKGGPTLVQEGLRASGRGALQLLPLLAVVFLLAGFVEVLLPRAAVATWLSDAAGLRGLLVAWIAGVLTPGGGPVGLPLAAALQRSGAGAGVLVTYVTSMSLLSFVRVPLELGIVGGRLTALRFLSNLLLPLLAGGLVLLLGRATTR